MNHTMTTAAQVYYTSCKTGIRGGQGFQINAATPGITPRSLEQVERLGLYVPPLSYPSQPTPEQLESFPISLIYERLEDGSAMLAQAQYTGKDYSGRFGNFFTHTLVIPEARDGKLPWRPIELYRSATWAKTASPQVDLPECSLAHLAARQVVSAQSALQFLQSGGRWTQLERVLTAALTALETRRRVLILDDPEAIPQWMAVATLFLPLSLARELTFNTYVKNPYQCSALMQGLISRKDTDFGFADHELQNQFLLLDFKENSFSALPPASGYAQVLKRMPPEALLDLSAYLATLSRPVTPAELITCLQAFHALRGQMEPGWKASEVLLFVISDLERHTPETLMNLWAWSRTQQTPLLDIWDFIHTVDGLLGESSHAREFRLSVLRTVFHQLPSDVSARRDLLQRVENWTRGMLAPDLAIYLLDDWRSTRLPVNDSAALGWLLRVGGNLGLLDQDPLHEERIGQQALGPALAESPSWGNDFVQSTGLLGSRALWRGVVRALSTQDFRRLRLLTPALEIPAIARVLEELCLEIQDCRVYGFLAIRPDRSDPVRAFQEGIQLLRQQFPSEHGADLIHVAFRAVWIDELPSLPQGLEVMKLIQAKSMSLSSCGLLLEFEQVLDREGRFENVSPQQHEYVHLLASEIQWGSRVSLPVVAAYQQLLPPLSRGMLEAGDLTAVSRLLEQLPRHGSATREKLLETLTSKLFTNTLDFDRRKSFPSEAVSHLRGFLSSGLKSDPPRSAQEWAKLYVAVGDLGTKFPGSRAQFKQDFLGAFADWRPGTGANRYKAISKALGSIYPTKYKAEWDREFKNQINRVRYWTKRLAPAGVAGLVLGIVGFGILTFGPPAVDKVSRAIESFRNKAKPQNVKDQRLTEDAAGNGTVSPAPENEQDANRGRNPDQSSRPDEEQGSISPNPAHHSGSPPKEFGSTDAQKAEEGQP